MASGQALLEKYDELLSALMTFDREILQCAENMSNCGKVCLAAMGSDQLSSNSVAKLEQAVKQYREVTIKTSDLKAKLIREKENIKRLIDESKREG